MILTIPFPIIYRPVGYDIASWTLLLRPQKYNRVPKWLGRAIQAMFYCELNRIHPEIATYIHDTSQLKPFTLSNLMGAKISKDMLSLSPDRVIKFRITSLHPHMSAVIQNGILPTLKKYGLSLHCQPMRLIGFNRSDGWTGQSNFETLLKSAKPVETLLLEFISPTSFKRTGGIYVAKPMPDLVFKSLLTKWSSVSPVILPTALKDTIEQNIQLGSHQIIPHKIYFARGRKGVVPCFTGQVTYHINEPDRYLRRWLHALAQFASYSGVGVQTTVGLGQTRLINNSN